MIRLSDNLEINKPAPVDDRLGVFVSTASALTSIAEDRRYVGLTVIVDDGSGAVEYWFKDGVTDVDLVAKSQGGGGGVPYTGATQNVDLGEYQIKAGQYEFDQTPTQSAGVAKLRWNDTDGTLDLGLKGGNVNLQIGQEEVIRVVNNTGSSLLEANYQAVKVSGAQGQRLAVTLAQANNDANSASTIGLVTETIANNQEGFITTNGLVRNVDTTGALQSETWSDGDTLYLSGTTAGAITNVKPSAPIHTVILGYVVYAHQNNGKIFVKVDNGYELDELHNVSAQTPSNDDALIYESATQLWKNKQVTKSMVGLGNVDNTSDANKPISTATQTALNRITSLFQDVSQLSTTSTTAVTLTTFTVASANIPVGGVIRISGLIERTAGTGNTTVGINVNSGGARYLQSNGTNSQFEMLICKTTSTNVRYGLGASNTSGSSFTGHNSTSITVSQDGSGNFNIAFLGLVGTAGATLTVQFVKGNLL
jgi:hypothetical protein